MDGAKEDLMDMFRVHKLEEIQVILLDFIYKSIIFFLMTWSKVHSRRKRRRETDSGGSSMGHVGQCPPKENV